MVSIPSINLPNKYLLNDKMSIIEGTEIEYKKSFHVNQYPKYRETICAFLNTTGGHIIYGVLNDCTINGCKLNELEKDNIQLFIDRLYSMLVKNNGTPLHPQSLKVNFNEIAKDIYIVIISCYKEDNCKYQLITGDSWIRLNASNFKANQSKLYTKEDLKYKILKELACINNIHKNEIDDTIKDTIIMVSDILYDKQKKESIMLYHKNYIYIIGYMLFFLNMFYFIFVKFM